MFLARLSLCSFFTTLLLSVAAAQTPSADEPPLLRYTTTWIGNSFAGTKMPGVSNRKHVQLDARAMYVTFDGTCYLATGWDEDGSEIGIYRDGEGLGSAGHTHGWGYGGGGAVTVSKDYLFFAQKVDSEGGGLKGAETWPVKGRVWYGISRRLRDGAAAAPFEGGKGGDGDTLKGVFLLVNEVAEGVDAEIAGLATDAQNHLFVSDPANAQIKVYDAAKMQLQRSWRVERPGAITINTKGELWVVQNGSEVRAARLLHLSLDGHALPDSFELPKEVKPGGVCLDASGRMMVTDRGPAQQVLVYDTHNVPPLLTSTIGVKGGVFAGRGAEIGRDGPLRFNDPVGVGVDRAGNIYVCSRGSVAGGGTLLDCYDEDIKRIWRLEGLAFIDTADVDPASDGAQVYTKDKHFALDFTKPIGQDATYKGYTANRFKYPDDPRLRTGDCGVFFRRIQGKPFLFVTDMYSGGLRVFRFKPDTDGECAIPSGYFAKEHVKPDPAISKQPWPTTQPEKGEWIWRDNNGNGTLDADEFDGKPTNAPGLWGWCVDSQGTVWQATEHDGIRKFPMQGLDKLGNPIYSYAMMQTTPTPALFTELCRAEYVPETDTMFLSGYTKDHPHTGGEWGIVGTEIVRYENWSQGAATQAARALLPYDGLKDAKKFIKSFAVAGDYLFAGEGREPCAIYVYNAKTGAAVGKLQPDAKVGAHSGWLDFPYAIRAFRRSNGEYLIFAEEDLDAKVILYRWKP